MTIDRRCFKVLIPGVVRVGAGTTQTFTTRTEAEDFLRSENAESTGTIYEVDEIGRRIEARMVGLASAGSLGGIEEYLCTHCWFRTDLPDVAHNCYEYGRDDSVAMKLSDKTHGLLKLQNIQNMRPPEFLVDWTLEGASDTWRTLLNQQEVVELMATNHWGGEISTLSGFGLQPRLTFEMNEQILRKFGFRHLRKM
jgi:hypothetical protein